MDNGNIKYTVLMKYGEIVLKGLNRGIFEANLLTNVKRRLHKSGFGKFDIRCAQSTMFITPLEDVQIEELTEVLRKIFGFTAMCVAARTEKEMPAIYEVCLAFDDQIMGASSFKVEAKRADKKFSLNSMEIMYELGGYILEKYPHIKVDVHNPEITINVEIREFGAYVHLGRQQAAGGLPTGTAGKAALLISGGIDSPVAAHMIAKRGVQLTAIHFESPPYTNERAKDKVLKLLKIVSEYAGQMDTYIVPFTGIQEKIRDYSHTDYFTLLMRRYMMKMAERIAVENGCQALVTGESLAQVASQTMTSLAVTDSAVNMPVFRPLIGMDKEEIIKRAREIDTFETSILPYEDCCTIFTPKHPCTKPKLQFVEKLEAELMMEEEIDRAIAAAEKLHIRFEG